MFVKRGLCTGCATPQHDFSIKPREHNIDALSPSTLTSARGVPGVVISVVD